MKMTMAVNAAITIVIVLAALLVYDRIVVGPVRQVGVIDVAEVFRLKEREFAEKITKAGSSETERTNAAAMAGQFAKAFPQALNEAAEECNCLVLVRSAVVSDQRHTIDLTSVVKRKVGLE